MSNLDQRVTQWMSWMCSVRGSAFSSSQVSVSSSSTSPETRKVPRREVDSRDRAGVQHRPLLGQVLPRRQARGVVARVDHLAFGLGAEHRLYSNGMRVASRPRSFVRVAGPDAEEYLNRMVSNDVAALGPGESCEALLLTAKARVIAPLVVLRRGHEDFLLLTEPELGERVRAELVRFRFAAKAEIELEEHTSHVVFGGDGIPTDALRRARGGGAGRGSSSRPSRPTSSSCCGSERARPRGARRSTTACSRPRRA